MRKFLTLIFIAFVLISCKKQEPELVTINAAAYLDGNKAICNFALIKPEQAGIIGDEGSIDRYFAIKGIKAHYEVSEFSEKVTPGEYVLVVQLKETRPGVFFNTYTYNFITTNGTAAKSNYVMQFSSGRTVYYQPWVDRK